MLHILKQMMDDGSMPRATLVSDSWHVPQFSMVYEAATRTTRVAMLIVTREPLYAEETPQPDEIDRLFDELHRFSTSKWATIEAQRAASFLRTNPPTGFVAILEHAAVGAYATRAQQLKAYYSCDNGKIGVLQPYGHKLEICDADQCITV